jgi:hypothetical protein
VTVVCGGDWVQALPVVPGDSVPDIVAATLQRSPVWRNVSVLSLRTNMRLRRPGSTAEQIQRIERFAQWLRDVETGRVNSATHMISHFQTIFVSFSSHLPSWSVSPEMSAPDVGRDEPYLPMIEQCYGNIANQGTSNLMTPYIHAWPIDGGCQSSPTAASRETGVRVDNQQSARPDTRLVGLDLTQAVFSQGQLYVELSRVTNAESSTILLPNNVDILARKALNVVYPQIFQS